jgi:carboxylate-amine ligase
MPDQLESWDKYLEMVRLLTNTGIITGVRDLWWDIRPHPDFGTIEIRISDLPSTFTEILAIVALIQGLVAEMTQSDKHLNPNMQVLKSNKWQAARYGLAGTFVYPLLQKKMSMQEAAGELFTKAAPTMEKLGTSHYLSDLQHILESGTSADHQRKIFTEQKNFSTVIKELHPTFWQ